jgi:omega-6 fatty acid desaturase (delta-12 desaturase)
MYQNKVTSQLRELQHPDWKQSTLHIALTAAAGYGSIVFSVMFFKTIPSLLFVLVPISFICLCRSFVILHDAGHFALFKNRVYNSIAGNLMGIMNMIPNEYWSHIHNLHHATIGDLNKRHINPELWTMTSDEYLKSSASKKFIYRFARSGFMRIALTPFIIFIIARFPLPKLPSKANVSALIYDVIYGGIIYLSIRYNFWEGLLVGYILPVYLFNVFAIVIFYLQHQFEETQWLHHEEWNFYDAALKGSSFLKLGPFLNWTTGSVGYHHIHHLNSKIPFYNLQRAHRLVEKSIDFKEVKISELFRHLNGKLWDEKANKMIHYSDLYGR